MNVYFILKCKCQWWRRCDGTTESLKDLVEFKPCRSCHVLKRMFKCPKCASIMKMERHSEPTPPEPEKPVKKSRKKS